MKKQFAVHHSEIRANNLNALINVILKGSIPDYKATKWCELIKHTTEDIWLIDLGEGIRNEIILQAFPDLEIIEVDLSDENYFPKIELPFNPQP
jgi:hypothetical protein